jgi:hypothetical protein
MAVIEIADIKVADDSARKYCGALENGDILFFPRLRPSLSDDDLDWLLTAKGDGTSIHKNISYRPTADVVRGFSAKADKERLQMIMRAYSAWAVEFLGKFLSPYDNKWALDYASFRPLEEKGRDLPVRKSNELLHVDAFPTRPTWGGRILRFFSNINPAADRVWMVGERFPDLARKHADAAGLARVVGSGFARAIRNLPGRVGLPLPVRSAYDEFMLGFHHYMKENGGYQDTCERTQISFPPGSSWAVYTDGVPHAALSGRYALEQTFIVPHEALVEPHTSPLDILEKIAGKSLTVT